MHIQRASILRSAEQMLVSEGRPNMYEGGSDNFAAAHFVGGGAATGLQPGYEKEKALCVIRCSLLHLMVLIIPATCEQTVFELWGFCERSVKSVFSFFHKRHPFTQIYLFLAQI